MPHPVPVTVEALTALLTAQTVVGGALAKVIVSDGEPVHGVDEPDAIGVGLDVVDPSPMRSVVQQKVGTEWDLFDVKCVAKSYSGAASDDVRIAIRRRAYELLDAVRALVQATPTLGLAGVVMRAWVSSSSYQYEPVENGFMAAVEFAVTVQAYRSRR